MAQNHEKFQLLTEEPFRLDVVTTILGNVGEVFTENDVGKAMKMGTGQNYVLCSAGDEIEGFLDTVMTAPMGSEFDEDGNIVKRMGGGVAKRTNARMIAEVASGAEAVALLGYVVAAAQPAVGTKGSGRPLVQAGTPTIQRWRVIRVMSGASESQASAGDTVLIERA